MLLVDENIFSFMRKAYGFNGYLVIMNISDSIQEFNIYKKGNESKQVIDPIAYVAYYITSNKNRTIKDRNGLNEIKLNYKHKEAVSTKNIRLNARDCLILTCTNSDYSD